MIIGALAGSQTKRVWIALAALPLLLGVTFAPVIAYLASTRGLSGDALAKAMEPLAPLPGAIGFAAALSLTRWLAKKDGLSLADVGWGRPSAVDVGVGVSLAGVLSAANAYVFYPLIQTSRPTFDPTLPNVSLPAAMALMTVAVVAEDTLYRGYAWTVLQRRHGTLFAVGVTSLFYAAVAPGAGLPLMLWALCFGVVLCGIRLWRKRLWPVVIVHWLVALGPKLVFEW